MLKNPFDTAFGALPETLPVFPLADVLLLPGGQVPLNVFEGRYVNMVQDALAARDRLIGLVLPDGEGQPVTGAKRSLSKVGCAGRVTSFEETADGRFLIVLTGYCRFRLVEEVPTMRSYRRFSVGWEPYEQDLSIDLNPDIDRDKLIKLLKDYAQISDIEMDWKLLVGTPNFNIVTFFSMNLPFESRDKQLLIEAQTIEDRAEVLIALIEAATKSAKKGSK